MTSLEELHQRKRDDEADGRPFQASQKHVKHFRPILAQALAALKQSLNFGLPRKCRSIERTNPLTSRIEISPA